MRDEPRRRVAHDEAGDDRGEQDAGAGGREQVEAVDRRLRRRRRRPPAAPAGPGCAGRRPGTCRSDAVQPGLHLREAPDEDEDAEDDPGHPGARHRAARHVAASRCSCRPRPRVRGRPVRAAPRSSTIRGCQTLRKQRQAAIETSAATTSTSHGPWKFETRNCGTAKRRRRPGSPARPRACRGSREGQISQNGTINEKNGSCRPTMALSVEQVEPGDAGQRDDRRAERAEGHRRGVGDQRQAGGGERREAQADQHRAR